MNNLTNVRTTKSQALKLAKAINKNMNARKIKREAYVKKMSVRSVKPLLRKDAYEIYKKQKQIFWGVYMRNKK